MSYEAEMAVIGGMIMDKECANIAADALAPEMFTDENLGKVFSEALNWYWEGKPIDGVVLIKSLPDLGPLILRCAKFMPKFENYSEYVTIVQDEWQWGLVSKALDDIEINPGSLEDKVGKLRELVDQQERLLSARTEKGLSSFSEAANEFLNWLADSTRQETILTGYSALDNAMGGFMRGTVAVIAGRPGGGKTDFAINLALKMAKRDARVLYFSMEMTNNQLMQRVAAFLTRINGVKLRDKTLDTSEMKEASTMLREFAAGARINFVQEPMVSVKRIRHYIELVSPDVIVIDHLGLMDRPRIKDQFKALGMVSNSLKQLALEKDICIIELVQMNRQIEARSNKKPSLTDLRESGDIEQDADYAMFLIPQDLKDVDLEGPDSAESTLYLEKNRHGRPGVFKFAWQPQYHRFAEYDRRYE